ALVEEAVSVGDVVRLFEFLRGGAHMVELTPPESSPYAGSRVGDVPLPPATTLTTILRAGQAITPSRDGSSGPGDRAPPMSPARTRPSSRATRSSSCARPRRSTSWPSPSTRRAGRGSCRMMRTRSDGAQPRADALSAKKFACIQAGCGVSIEDMHSHADVLSE